MKKIITFLVLVILLPQFILSQTFSNTSNVCPTDNNLTGTTSVINVTGAGTILTSVTVNIPNISHTWYDDLDIMLISPTGERIILMSDCGGNNGGTGNRNYVFVQGGTSLSDGAAPTASGNVSPTNFLADTWPDGAPTITAMNQFTGNPNGNWIIRVIDDGIGDTGCLNGGWSITIVATTPSTPPSCAGSPTAPANGATGVANSPTLSWPTVAGATGYDVYFGSTSPASTLVSSNQVGTTYNPGSLSPGTTYYWRIVPRNASGAATGCTDWSFTTCTPAGNPAIYGSGSWIGYVYNSATAGAFTSYQGFVTEATVFNRTHTTASGATVNHCSSNQDFFAIRYRNTINLPAGLYTFTVGGDDGVRFSIDGGATWLINQWVDQGYTTVSSAQMYLSGSTDMVFEYYENGGGSQSSFNYTFSPDPCSTITPLSCGAASSYSMTAITGAWNTYGGLYGVPGQEVLYSFTPTVSGNYNIVVNSSAGYVDLFWKAASIGCNTTSWTYLNDITGTETSSVTLTAGVQYYFLLDDENTTANTGSITINCPTPPAWQGQWVSMNTGSSNWCAGETRTVSVTVKNNGTSTWTNATPDINIGVKWNADADYFVRVDANGLAPGATQTYNLTVTAPNTAGYDNLTFDIVNELNFWFASNSGGAGPGNTVYQSAPIAISTAPTVNAGSDQTVCVGQNAQLTSSATGAQSPSMLSGSQVFTWTGNGYDGGVSGFLGDYIEGTTNGMPAGSVITSISYSTNVDYTSLGGGNYCGNWYSAELYTNGIFVADACDVSSVSLTTLNGQPANNQLFRLWLYDLDDWDDYAYMALTVTVNYSYPTVTAGTVTYSWSPAASLNNAAIANPIATPSSTTTYTLTASNNGCSATDQVDVILPTAGTALGNDNESATCLVNQNGWIHFYHSSGRLLASINSLGQDLGNVSVTSYVDVTNASVPACSNSNPIYNTSVMQRHWVITPSIQPSTPVQIRLPYSSAEFSSLTGISTLNANPNDDVFIPADVKLNKYSGPLNVNASALDNCSGAGGSGGTTQHNPTASGVATAYSTVGSAYYSEFSIPGFSEFWLNGNLSASPLPVELVSFNANCLENGSIDVSWVTASEHNASHYVVDKSVEGTTWATVATVQAAGNSTTTLNYSLNDAERKEGDVYYRLTQYDVDGKNKVYDPISIDCSTDITKSTIVTYPNPSSNSFYVELNAVNAEGFVILSIIDVHGSVVSSRSIEVKKGLTVISIDDLTVSPGMYYISVQSENDKFELVKHIVK